jgi:hypothetical protein
VNELVINELVSQPRKRLTSLSCKDGKFAIGQYHRQQPIHIPQNRSAVENKIPLTRPT